MDPGRKRGKNSNSSYLRNASCTPDPAIQVNLSHWNIQFRETDTHWQTLILYNYILTVYEAPRVEKRIQSKAQWWEQRALLGKDRISCETLTSRTTAETKKRELDGLRTGSTQLSVPGVSVLMGASRALLEAVPGAARQNHREDRICCHLLTDWTLPQRTNTSGHKPAAVQREESHKCLFTKDEEVLGRDLKRA